MPATPSAGPLLLIEDLAVHYTAARGADGSAVVDGVNLHVDAGSTLGLVGESGCGKTTLARAIFKLVAPSRGRILFDGVDVVSARGRALRRLRRDMQLVFQDPHDSLNPRMKAGEIVAEPLLVQRNTGFRQCRDEILSLFARVGLPAAYADRYPHELSGGQRQRLGIARALANRPRLVVCDEPVSALDVSVQAQILNLLADLQSAYRLSYLFIAHDLAVVRHISRRIAVMYRGRIVETGPADQVCGRPAHPYTRSLLDSVPSANPESRRPPVSAPWADQPEPAASHHTVLGCAFHPRCSFATEQCRQTVPRPVRIGDPDNAHTAACHYALDIREATEGTRLRSL